MGILPAGVGLRAETSSASYKQLRYDEDFSCLRDLAMRQDYLDPVKFVSMDGSTDAWLTLGGEVRERYEYYNNNLWGQGPQDNSGYLLQRYMLHADVHLGDSFRVFTQLKSGIEAGRADGPRPTDEDRLDLGQAFFDAKWSGGDNLSFTVRIGRQEISLGSSRLISFREGPNVRFAFDGFRGILQVAEWRIDALAVAPVQTKAETFDDGTDRRQKLWGLYAVTPFPAIPGGHLDLYYLGLIRDQMHFDEGTAREERHSVGVRLWGQSSGWDYNIEALYQFGTFGSGDIHAWTVASDTGYTFSQTWRRPRLSLKADIASGDRDPKQSNLQTFDPLFPRGAYFNESSLIGPANFFDLHPGLDLQVARNVSITLDWDFFWRESVHDGVYGPAVNLVRSGETSDARYIGSEPSLLAEWRSDRHWKISATYSHFYAGRFIRQSGSSQDVDYLSSWITYLF